MRDVFALTLSTAAFLGLGLLFGGCASRPKIDPNINWSERIGSYTYEQALAELGPPAAISESGEGRSADWILKRSPQMSFGFGVGGGTYGSHVGTGVGVGTSVSPRGISAPRFRSRGQVEVLEQDEALGWTFRPRE